MLLDDLQRALTQAAALAHIGGEADAALGLFCGGQGLHGLAVSGVQFAEAGSGAADTDDAMLPQGTLGQLADLVGVSRQTINAIEKGDYNPTIRLCIAICRALNRTLDDLFWEEA